jgi:hypothetical protein
VVGLDDAQVVSPCSRRRAKPDSRSGINRRWCLSIDGSPPGFPSASASAPKSSITARVLDSEAYSSSKPWWKRTTRMGARVRVRARTEAGRRRNTAPSARRGAGRIGVEWMLGAMPELEVKDGGRRRRGRRRWRQCGWVGEILGHAMGKRWKRGVLGRLGLLDPCIGRFRSDRVLPGNPWGRGSCDLIDSGEIEEMERSH